MPTSTAGSQPPVADSSATAVGNYFIANYPPFSCWNTDDIPPFLEVLSRPVRPAPLGLYLHLPFCRQRCHYCYFRVYPRRDASDIDRYVAALLKEFELHRRSPATQGRPLNSVYFGGGTPSYLTEEQIRLLLGNLQQGSSWDSVEECTFECEPGTVDVKKFRALKELGVTRVSLGFQSLDDGVLRRNGRDVSAAECLHAFAQAREAGCDDINVDLLAGLAGQTERAWRVGIDQVLGLSPECVTIYQLELTYNSRLYSSMNAGRRVSLPSWREKREWVRRAFAQLEAGGYSVASGYQAIKRPGRWRSVYTVEQFWHGGDLLALGESAFGHFQGAHYQNFDQFDRYVSCVEQGELPLRRALRLRPEERLRREVILLLKTGRLDCAYFHEKFGIDVRAYFRPQFDALEGADLMETLGNEIRLTRAALLKVDSLLPAFYLPEHVGIRYT